MPFLNYNIHAKDNSIQGEWNDSINLSKRLGTVGNQGI